MTGLKTSGVLCKSDTEIMLKTLEAFIIFPVPPMYVISVGLGLVVCAELPDSVESRDFVVRMSAELVAFRDLLGNNSKQKTKIKAFIKF